MPGFPRHTQNLGASRRKARRGERSIPTPIAAEVVEDLQAALAQFAAVTAAKQRPGFPMATDLKQ